MHIAATLTSKGQITIPIHIRRALELETGDSVIFRLEDDEVTITRVSDLLDLAGSIEVPAGREGADWDEVRQTTRRDRYAD